MAVLFAIFRLSQCLLFLLQVRLWKRSLYSWAGEEPSDSTHTSYCNSDAESVNGDDDQDQQMMMQNENETLMHAEVCDKLKTIKDAEVS